MWPQSVIFVAKMLLLLGLIQIRLYPKSVNSHKKNDFEVRIKWHVRPNCNQNKLKSE